MPAGWRQAYIGLGANLGDPQQQVVAAIDALEELGTTRLCARSSLYRTAPVSPVPQDDYVNAVVRLETVLSPRQLLDRCQQIEHALGKLPKHRDMPRRIDLDILHYQGVVSADPALILPHPRWDVRAFVLVPLLEICSVLTLATGKVVDINLLLTENCPDYDTEIRKIEETDDCLICC